MSYLIAVFQAKSRWSPVASRMMYHHARHPDGLIARSKAPYRDSLEKVASAVQLLTFSVSGFRSLTHVADLPVSSPTILAGHNDGGKTAVLHALEFLIGPYKLSDRDRTYATIGADQASDPALTRSETTWVEGLFALDSYEQGQGFPAKLRIRRRDTDSEKGAVLEYFSEQPEDVRLRNVEGQLLPALKALASEYDLTPAGRLKDDFISCLNEHTLTLPKVQCRVA